MLADDSGRMKSEVMLADLQPHDEGWSWARTEQKVCRRAMLLGDIARYRATA